MGKLWQGDHLLRGRQPTPDDIQLMSNDYLCIQGEHSLRHAQARVLQASHADLLMSSVFAHGDTSMARLERAMADYMKAEDSIICQSGWSANVGLIQTIADQNIPVYLDMQAHASLWEGAHAAGAKIIGFRHNDADHAERQLQKSGAGVIVVDAVYSVNGSLCPLVDFVEVAERSGCLIVVDESHSLGTHGPQGAGLTVALGLQDRVHFRTASLAKTFAGRAGLITGSQAFKEYFRVESRPAIFSSGLLEHEYMWFSVALDFIRKAEGRRERLHSLSKQVRSKLIEEGCILADGSEQIIALHAGSEPQALTLRNELQKRGIFGAVFCAPATPKNRCVIRLSMNSALSVTHVGRLIKACVEAQRALH
ncbi:hypothetical protein LCM4573_08890 [Rhizobium sp. LCM 4573]|nr:hypothetical protein LCM4573_08890 [Rhizobium sp. LCM 4573]